jgi:NAD(P)-dependent dehydrogenase (short-subunit alcohol dehydrogenase family)
MKIVEGKTAFITGGGSGVGFGMAQVFADAGMKVVIADIRQDHLDQAMAHFASTNHAVHAIRLDVTDREAFAAAADEAERVFGKVHLVCNNAGINLFADMGQATYDDWDWVMGVNLGGVVNGVQTFISRIKSHGEGGHIVNTASMAAFIAGPGAGIYTASKFAVRGLSEALRYSLAAHNIGVSVLCPGLVKSHIYESDKIRPEALSANASKAPEAFMERLAAVHDAGMDPVEVGRKVLNSVRANELYIFPHPEFKDELAEIFDEALAAIPVEEAPAERFQFEEGRRAAKKAAKAKWSEVG